MSLGIFSSQWIILIQKSIQSKIHQFFSKNITDHQITIDLVNLKVKYKYKKLNVLIKIYTLLIF